MAAGVRARAPWRGRRASAESASGSMRHYSTDATLTLSPPTLGECRHGGLARRRLAVLRLTIFVGQDGPQPRRSNRRGVHLHDAADNCAVGEHVEIVVVPLAR